MYEVQCCTNTALKVIWAQNSFTLKIQKRNSICIIRKCVHLLLAHQKVRF